MFGSSSANIRFFYAGATKVSTDEYLLNPENYQNGNYIVYGYNVCDAFYDGKHDLKTDGSANSGVISQT